MNPSIKSVAVFFLCVAFAAGRENWTYDDLEALGANCPARDRCSDYRGNLSYMERSCECDRLCTAYKDCCIDAPSRRSTSARPAVRTNVKCLHYGETPHTGVYVISKCSRDWSGPREIRQKCLGSVDLTDPLTAAPVTDTSLGLTYRNLYCAGCNNANIATLTTFQLRMECGGLQLTDDQILGDLFYNENLQSWGINRLNNFGNATNFFGCDIIFDVPEYLNNSVRFCRSDLISRCLPGWRRPIVKQACEAYMAVVYDNSAGYKNPHCAICNEKTVDEISCRTELFSRKRPMSFALLLDVNQSDGDQVGMRRVATPECPSGHKYDPFFKRCRQLVCALPGHVVMDGRCVSGG